MVGPLSLSNGLSPAEKALIDSNINIFENPGYLRDQKLVDKLLHALKDEGPAFIYVEKYGVHFPYSDQISARLSGVSDARRVGHLEPPECDCRSVDAFLRSFLPP